METIDPHFASCADVPRRSSATAVCVYVRRAAHLPVQLAVRDLLDEPAARAGVSKSSAAAAGETGTHMCA
jgi:hypothetical protein